MKNPNTKVICEECKKCEAISFHLILKQMNLCHLCASKTSDDEINGKCNECGEELFECECEKFSGTDMAMELLEIHDILVVTFIAMNHPDLHQFKGNPHLTLLNQVMNKIFELSRKVSAL